MANDIYNYGQRRTSIDNPYVDEKSWYNYDNAPPTGIQYPGGNPAYPRNEGIYQARFDPAHGHIPYAPQEKRGFNFDLLSILFELILSNFELLSDRLNWFCIFRVILSYFQIDLN